MEKVFDCSNINFTQNMKYKGILVGSRSFNNLSLDILRSGLKNYILKDDYRKAKWCCIELDLFSYINAEPVRTNMINRLSYVYCESIGLSDINLLFFINNLETEWDKMRQINNPLCKCKLISIVRSLCESPKNNDVLAIIKVFKQITHSSDNIQNIDYLQFKDKVSKKPTINNYTIGDYWLQKQAEDSLLLVEYMDYFIYFIDKNSDNCIYWLYKIYNLTKNKKEKEKAGKRFKRYKPIYAVWEHLLLRAETEYTDSNTPMVKIINILLSWFLDKNEQISILVLGCLLFIRKYDYIEKQYQLVNETDTMESYWYNIDNKIAIDGFCIDNTIKEGKKLLIDIINPDIKYSYSEHITDQTYKNLYEIIINTEPIKTIYKKSQRKKKVVIQELEEDLLPGSSKDEINISSSQTQEIINFMKSKENLS